MNNRDFEMSAAVIAPEAPRRALSAGSLLVLDMLGNPLAGLMEDQVERVDLYSLAEFAWVHEAPRNRVQSAAVLARDNPQGIRAVVLEWADQQPPEWLTEVREYARVQIARATVSMAVHEKPSDSKNAPGPCSS